MGYDGPWLWDRGMDGRCGQSDDPLQEAQLTAERRYNPWKRSCTFLGS
jgi:hypothetical protein